jgi:hypothetical protein
VAAVHQTERHSAALGVIAVHQLRPGSRRPQVRRVWAGLLSCSAGRPGGDLRAGAGPRLPTCLIRGPVESSASLRRSGGSGVPARPNSTLLCSNPVLDICARTDTRARATLRQSCSASESLFKTECAKSADGEKLLALQWARTFAGHDLLCVASLYTHMGSSGIPGWMQPGWARPGAGVGLRWPQWVAACTFTSLNKRNSSAKQAALRETHSTKAAASSADRGQGLSPLTPAHINQAGGSIAITSASRTW